MCNNENRDLFVVDLSLMYICFCCVVEAIVTPPTQPAHQQPRTLDQYSSAPSVRATSHRQPQVSGGGSSHGSSGQLSTPASAVGRTSPSLAPKPSSSPRPSLQPTATGVALPPQPPREPYIELRDCWTPGTDSRRSSGRKSDGSNHSGSAILTQVPPPPRNHHTSLDSIPAGPAPNPPRKLGEKMVPLPPVDPSLYDHPTKSYVNLDDNENVYKIPRADSGDEGVYKIPRQYQEYEDDGLYKVPPSHQLTTTNWEDDDGLYKVPQSLHPVVQDQTDPQGLYDIPPPGEPQAVYDVPPQHSAPTAPRPRSTRHSTSSADGQSGAYSPGTDFYDVPKADSRPGGGSGWTGGGNEQRRESVDDFYDVPKPTKSVSEDNILGSVVPVSSKAISGGQPGHIRESRYQNLPPGSLQYAGNNSNSPQHWGRTASTLPTRSGHPLAPPAPGTITLDDLYDIPPQRLTDAEKLDMAPPPPPCMTKKHAYINAPSTYVNQAEAELEQRTHLSEPVAVTMVTDSGDVSDSRFSHNGTYSAPPSNRPTQPNVNDVVPAPVVPARLLLEQTGI